MGRLAHLSLRSENVDDILGLEQATANSPLNKFLNHLHSDDRATLKTKNAYANSLLSGLAIYEPGISAWFVRVFEHFLGGVDLNRLGAPSWGFQGGAHEHWQDAVRSAYGLSALDLLRAPGGALRW